jgi:nondiscriminating aspartyl-tRNA synthetase
LQKKSSLDKILISLNSIGNMRVLSSELSAHIGSRVSVAGALHKKREMGNLTFLVLRDRKGIIQIVDDTSEESSKLKGFQNGTILTIEGLVKEEPRASGGAEIHDPKITVDVQVTDVPPIEVDKNINHNPENFDTLFEYRYLNLRNLKERAIFRVQDGVTRGIREFFHANGFTEFRSPKILAGATEGGSEVFTMDYFGQTASLAQSAQFYKQMMVGVYERVFEIGATYRAEPSFTTRHMTEFTTIDMELGYIDSVEDVWAMTEKMVSHTIEYIWQENAHELELLGAKKPLLPSHFPRISLTQLHQMYFEATGDDLRNEKDPSPAEERWICEYATKNLGSEAVFITEFPSSEMSFYHMKNQDRPEIANRADLLFRGVEIATVPQREHRYEILLEQIKAKGLDPDSDGFRYYVSSFKYGLPAHGGFGMGLERLVQKILGLGSVKEASLFPRDVNRLAP